MKNYTISEERYKELEGLQDKFEKAEEQFDSATRQLGELENQLSLLEQNASIADQYLGDAMETMSAIRVVLFNHPHMGIVSEETEMEKLVRTTGLSAEELNRITNDWKKL